MLTHFFAQSFCSFALWLSIKGDHMCSLFLNVRNKLPFDEGYSTPPATTPPETHDVEDREDGYGDHGAGITRMHPEM